MGRRRNRMVAVVAVLLLVGCSDDGSPPPTGDGGTDSIVGWDGAGPDGAAPDSGLSCAAGTGDCNNDPGDGCETDTTSSLAHCGWCGHACGGGSCTASVCDAIKVADPQGSSTAPWNGFLALGPSNVYFGYAGQNAGGVAMVGKDGQDPACIACGQGMPRELTTDSTSVYWVDVNLKELRSALLDGSNVTALWSGQVGTPVAVDGSHVFWHDGGGNAVMQSDLDGSNAKQVATGQSDVGSIAVHSGSLFWTTQSALMALDLSGGSPTSLATGQTSPRSVAADASHVYWASGQWGQDEAVQRIPRGGGAIDQLTTPGANGAFALALDGTHLYAADNHGGKIWRIAKAGGNVQPLAVLQPNTFPFDIAVDNVAVYWSSETDATVAKVPK